MQQRPVNLAKSIKKQVRKTKLLVPHEQFLRSGRRKALMDGGKVVGGDSGARSSRAQEKKPAPKKARDG